MMAFTTFTRRLAFTALAVVVACGTAQAQSAGDRLTKLEQQVQALQTGPKPADVESRLLAMERAIELLTGQVEEARFRAERSAEQLRVLSEDLNLRIATLEQSIGAQPGALTPAPTAAAPAAPAPRAAASSQTPASQRFSLDAPASAPMNAPRASAPAPAVPQAAPQAATAGGDAAVDANGGFVVRTDAAGKPLAADPNAPAPVQQANAAPQAPPAPRASPAAPGATGQQLAALPVDVKLPAGAPKDQYDYAFDFLKRNDYARGEAALRQFLEKNPKDQLAGNAQYWLGEAFYVRANYQEAAVEFMKGYQTYPKNAKGPDNLLKLGMALEKLNQTDGACKAFGLIAKEYPTAPDQVKNATKAARTKLKCK